MHLNNISLDMGCHSCRQVTLSGIVVYKGEGELRNPSRTELLSIINPNSISCPHCGRSGNCEVFSADYGGYIYDYREQEPTGGILQVEVTKSGGDLKGGIRADRPDFALVDSINAVNYALKHLRTAKGSERAPWVFEPRESGEFFCKALYSTQGLAPPPPSGSYFGMGEIKAGTGSSYGIAYEELEETLLELKSSLEGQRQRY